MRSSHTAPPPASSTVDDTLLADIEELGREFTRLGWLSRLPALREFYAAARAGQPRTTRWSAEHLERIRSVLGLGANPLPVATRCPRCPAPAAGAQWSGARTVLHLEDRWVSQCADCSAEWVTLRTR